MNLFPIAHYILAGGKSRRFGSDKARYLIQGQPMIQRVAQAFSSVASHTVVVAQQPGQYEDLGLATIADLKPGAGPLQGVYTALTHARSHAKQECWLLISSCDLHAPQACWAHRLNDARSTRHLATTFRSQGFLQPFPGLYHTTAAAIAKAQHARNQHSMQAFLNAFNDQLCVVALPQEAMTPLDLDRPPSTE